MNDGRADARDRVARWGAASGRLAEMADVDLADLLRAGRRSRGIGGSHAILDVGGVTASAKSVPLTDEERRAGRSTSNLFGLPPSCQYGVGSPGFNVWREVAAHEQTTDWFRLDESDGFPLLYHWRVLPGSDYEVQPEHADVQAAVSFFGDDLAVARRIEATAAASWSVVLVLEHIPLNVHDWLARELVRDDAAAAVAVEAVLGSLPATLRLMNDRELFHFDSHLSNILTDGSTFFVSDFGLATSTTFDLTDREQRFVANHALHDPAYTISRIINQVVTALSGAVDPLDPDHALRNDYIRRCAESGEAPGLSPSIGALVARFAPITAVMNEFYWGLFEGSPFPEYPRDAVMQALAASDVWDLPRAT